MRDSLFALYQSLKTNEINTISFYRQNSRYEKKYAEFVADVETALSKLDYRRKNLFFERVAIIGPVSYDWIVCDMACIKGGYQTIAIPETISELEIINILNKTKAEIVLFDFILKDKLNLKGVETYYIECPTDFQHQNFWLLKGLFIRSTENRILREYGIVFSSGTSKSTKFIKSSFPETEQRRFTGRKPIQSSNFFSFGITNFFSPDPEGFWSKGNNTLIIFMPFSHPQQREFFRKALFLKINILLSDALNCAKHIIVEKPNIMITVPIIYEAMAARIKSKIAQFNITQKVFFNIYLTLGVNKFSNGSVIKDFFNRTLFFELQKIYGGRADYFVTGSAPINTEVLEIFYSVGVKILQAYGQTEIGNISMNTPTDFKIGSVGKPIMDVRISGDEEIMVKYNDSLHSHNRDILRIDKNGYIHTGDLGYLDPDGYLFVTGRTDDLIVLENGTKLFPEKIESLLKKTFFIKDVCVFTLANCQLYAVLDCEGNPSENEVKNAIHDVNQQLGTSDKIQWFYVTGERFSDNNSLITSNFKKKRETIKNFFSDRNFKRV